MYLFDILYDTVTTIYQLTRAINLSTLILGFTSVIPNTIIIFKPDEVEQACVYAMFVMFSCYVLLIASTYYYVIGRARSYVKINGLNNRGRYRDAIRIITSPPIANLSQCMGNWIASLISLAMQIIYLLGKNDKNNIIYDWMSQVMPLAIVFLMISFIFINEMFDII
jgi:hypothetical protein